jgi:hypothetical protein
MPAVIARTDPRAETLRRAAWDRHDAAVVVVVGPEPVALVARLLSGTTEADRRALPRRLDRAEAAYARFDLAEREAHPEHAALYDALDRWAEKAGPALLGGDGPWAVRFGTWPHDLPTPPDPVPGHLERVLAAFAAADAGADLRFGLAVALRTLGTAAALTAARQEAA